MTPTVAMLVFANIAVHLLVPAGTVLYMQMALVPGLIPQQPWTLLTYQFVHAPGFGHIFFNMLSLFFFGPALEVRLGSRRFLTLYLFSGIMGAALSAVFPATRWTAIVGASGAVYGVMLAFARFWPRERVYLWGILGVEARILVGVMTLLSLYGGLQPGRDNIAHFAHLGGFVGGWIYLKWLEKHSSAAQWKRRVQPLAERPTGTDDMERWRRIDPGILHPVNREYYDQVMAKLAALGPAALSVAEREFLDRFAAR
jgi:membrane associated rhomboid family serine protease